MSSGWIDAMRAGDFARAWEINDRDLIEIAHPPKHMGPRHLQRIWRGEDLNGKNVLVRCYHGLGDTIQFLRFMRPLRDIARSVTIWCQSELLPLVERTDGVDRAFALHDGAPDHQFEVDIEIMEVPHAVKARRDQIEMRIPYLALPSAVAPTLPQGGGRAVGLVWEVGNWDKRRTIPSALLRRLVVPGVTLCSLQLGAGAAELAEIGAIDISTPDVVALGHVLQQLDLVVCVDTMVAHLAGALGYDAWVLLHADCDWRWPLAGSRSSWYPSLTLFHQRVSGDWDHVISDVRNALVGRVSELQGVV
ncbi:hypothetical protein IVB26_40160 (plasmid) [Bradyrhizobium sp. 195]|nr:hypothetical protein IVB26_40160 [Bradyrhizobium sp. 195]